ncbi:hypothetical protein BH23BAC2_BH23BAC2_21920 [soil metagenome]
MLNKIGKRKSVLKNLFALPRVCFFLLGNVYRQKRFIKEKLAKDLEPFKRRMDAGLSEKDLKKITSYYALGVPAILGESLCILRGLPMTKNERMCLTYLGGISGLLDDLFDDPEKEAAHLESFILKPEVSASYKIHEYLLIYLYQKGLSFSPKPEKIKEQATKVFKAQQKSEAQKLKVVSGAIIKDLTCSKGGSSFIFYRLCLEHELSREEEDLLFHLGGVMQLGNDIFDVWEDHQSQTTTAATGTKDIQTLRKFFITELEKTGELAWSTYYKKKDIEKFLQIVHLALARVFVCLDQFEKLQISTGNTFCIEKYTRKQTICDMQKPANQLNSIKYFLQVPV